MHFDGGKEDENGRGFCEVFFDSLTVTMVSMLVCGSVGYDTGIQRNLKMSSNKSSAASQHHCSIAHKVAQSAAQRIIFDFNSQHLSFEQPYHNTFLLLDSNRFKRRATEDNPRNQYIPKIIYDVGRKRHIRSKNS